MNHWTPKVEARALFAQALKDSGRPFKGIKLADLEGLIEHAVEAKAADEQQKVQLAAASAGLSARSDAARSVMESETELREVGPAVVADLFKSGQVELARFLQRLSFARFRLRELTPSAGDAGAPGGGGGEDDVVKKVERVAREDHLTRARALAAYIGAILAPEREALAAAFAERDVSADALRAMQASAQALVDGGKNQLASAEATERESAAVTAQQAIWSAIRRLARRAAKQDPELAKLYAEC